MVLLAEWGRAEKLADRVLHAAMIAKRYANASNEKLSSLTRRNRGQVWANYRKVYTREGFADQDTPTAGDERRACVIVV